MRERTTYWRLDSSHLDDSAHYDLLACSLCGALVHPSTKSTHEDWHDEIAEAVELTQDIRFIVEKPLAERTS